MRKGFVGLGAVLALSACQSVPKSIQLPQRGPFISGGWGIDRLQLTVPCQSAHACNVAPQFRLEDKSANGMELGGGYRVNRYLSLQVESMLWVSSGPADTRPALPTGDLLLSSDLRPKNFVRPALRADLPLGRLLSVYATYGMQLEDLLGSTEYFTGDKITYTVTTTCDATSPPDCKAGTTTQTRPEVRNGTYHHRDLHPVASVGLELFGLFADMPSTSMHIEYMPRVNGRISSIVFGVSWHFGK